jgi:protein-tyrosine-phosphatase
LLAALELVPSLEDDLRGRRRVVFVCTQNSARSQLAASAWQRVSSLPATSAGTHPAARVHPGAVQTAKRHGLPLGDTTTRHVDDVLATDDLVVAVCDQVHEELPDGPPLHWSVPDPARSARPEDLEAAFDDITHRVVRLAATLDPRSN